MSPDSDRDGQCLYAVLNVAKDASDEDIKRAYRSLAQVWHPDKQSTADDTVREKAQEVFAKIQEAHEVLTDHTKRQVRQPEWRLVPVMPSALLWRQLHTMGGFYANNFNRCTELYRLWSPFPFQTLYNSSPAECLGGLSTAHTFQIEADCGSLVL